LFGLVLVAGAATVLVAGAKGQLMGVQLGRDPARVRALIADPQRRAAMRRGLWVDFGFLTSYWLAFVGLAILLGHRGTWGYLVGAAAVLAATATALLDVVENVRTFGVLARNRPTDVVARGQVVELRRTSLAKWGCSALTVALLATTFLQSGWVVWIGIGLLALAAIGLCGLAWNALIPLYLLVVGGAALFLAALFLCSPGTILRGLT
jgi:hypothetical protein